MKPCLIVIDAPKSFRHHPYSTERNMAPCLAAQNALIEGCVAADVPVVRVLHVDGPEIAGNPFAQVSGHARPLESRPLAAADIRARTATVPEGRFAHICTVDEALARIDQTVAA